MRLKSRLSERGAGRRRGSSPAAERASGAAPAEQRAYDSGRAIHETSMQMLARMAEALEARNGRARAAGLGRAANTVKRG